MTELETIQREQRTWAESRGITLDAHGRTHDLRDNLFQPLDPQTQAEFEQGAGNELQGDLRSLRSSAALACNVFDPWRQKPLKTLNLACGADPGLTRLRFEATYPTGLRGTPPHLDVVLEGDGIPTAIESKFTEIYTPGKHAGFAASYFERAELWDSWPKIQGMAQLLCQNPLASAFGPLDVAQLIKHAMGLRKAFGITGYRLLYLWYDARGPIADAHRGAVDRFRSEVAGEIPFDSMTYQDLFVRLSGPGDADAGHLEYLEQRYFGSSRRNSR